MLELPSVFVRPDRGLRVVQDNLLEEHFGEVMSAEPVSDTDAYAPGKEVLPNKARSCKRLFKLDNMMTLNNHEFALLHMSKPLFNSHSLCVKQYFLVEQLRECGRGATTCCLSSCALSFSAKVRGNFAVGRPLGLLYVL